MFIELTVGYRQEKKWVIINTDDIVTIYHAGGNNKPPDKIILKDKQYIEDIDYPTYQEIKDILCGHELRPDQIPSTAT